MVTLYKLYFLSSHFSSQPNKIVFYPFTFLPSQPNTYERKLNLFYLSTFPSSLYSLSSQTNPKSQFDKTIIQHFTLSQPNIYEKKLNFFYHSTFFYHFSIFYPPKRTLKVSLIRPSFNISHCDRL